MRFAAVQFDVVWEDKPRNHAIIEGMLQEARPEPESFVLLPELGDTGFSFNLDSIVDDRSLSWATRFAAARRIWLQPGYARLGPDGRGRNCAALVTPAGDVAGVYEKLHPFSYGNEIRHFGSGRTLLLRSCGPLRVCPLICYDLRFPELWRFAALRGAEVFTIGASWPDARQSQWRSLLIARAIENQAYVVAANRVGRDPHLGYAGGSIIVSPRGEVLAEADDSPCVLSADLDAASLRAWRREFPALADVRRELLGSIDVDMDADPAPAAEARGAASGEET